MMMRGTKARKILNLHVAYNMLKPLCVLSFDSGSLGSEDSKVIFKVVKITSIGNF